MFPEAAAFAERVETAFLAAIATPMTSDGSIDSSVTRDYAEHVVRSGATGLAAAVHTGRGSELSVEERLSVIACACEASEIVVTGTFPSTPHEEVEWARVAGRSGASALLVFPASSAEPSDAYERLSALWEASRLPLIAFDLYSRPLTGRSLRRQLTHPAVAAFKPARLLDLDASRRGIGWALAASKTVLSGEDLMLPESIAAGATGALIGLGAATTELTAAYLRAHHRADSDVTTALRRPLTDFATATFAMPYDAYVQRMLWIAVDEGSIPDAYGFDARGSHRPESGSREQVTAIARECRRIVSAMRG